MVLGQGQEVRLEERRPGRDPALRCMRTIGRNLECVRGGRWRDVKAPVSRLKERFNSVLYALKDQITNSALDLYNMETDLGSLQVSSHRLALQGRIGCLQGGEFPLLQGHAEMADQLGPRGGSGSFLGEWWVRWHLKSLPTPAGPDARRVL